MLKEYTHKKYKIGSISGNKNVDVKVFKSRSLLRFLTYLIFFDNR